MRTAPFRGPRAEEKKSDQEHAQFSTPPASPQDSLDDLKACIEAAEAYEYELETKQLKLRKFILNAIAYRDALEDFGRAIWTGARP